jgi:hypothetical protein
MNNQNKIRRSRVTGDNIYHSRDAQKHNRAYKGKNDTMFKKGRKPKESGVVHDAYNSMFELDNKEKRVIDDLSCSDNLSQDSVFSDDSGSLRSLDRSRDNDNRSIASLGDHMTFFKRGNMMRDNSRFEGQIKQRENDNGKPSYFSQFEDLEFDNPKDPVSSNNTPHKRGNNAGVSRMEMERDIALKGEYSNFNNDIDMTYGVVDEQNFIHNNMVPNFKRGIGKGYGPNSEMQKKWDEIKQRKVDTFSGSTKNIEYRPKTERRPLFNPHVGLTNIYGMPNFTDFMGSRFIPGKERRNEKIHQETRVTPGLNLGYNEVSKHGYHDTWRALPKTVDELRTANNPKISYGRPVIPGLKSTKRPIISNVAKRKPITFREQDPRDFVKSLGYYRAPSIYGNYEAPHTNRQQTTRAWYAPAGADPTVSKPESMYPYYKRSHKENFESATPRNVTGVDKTKTPAFDMVSNVPDPTLRNETEKNTWLNVAKPEWSKNVAFDMVSNIPDPTLRNLTENKTWLNGAGPEWQKNVAFDMVSNVPDPTLRNLTEKKTWLNGAGPEWQKTYAFDNQTNIPDPTLRNLTEKRTWLNAAGPEWQKGVAFDNQTNIPDPTLRNLTEKKTWLNGAGPEWQKTYAFDNQTNIPDPTLRNLTEKRTWLNAAGPEWQKGVAFDNQTNIPDPTLRNLTEKRTWLNATGPEWQKGVAFDNQTNIPDPTLRNLTEKKTWLNSAGPEWQKGVAFDMVSNIPDPTIRNTTERKNWLNAANPEWQKGIAFDMVSNIPDPTIRNTTEKRTWLNAANPEWEKGVAFDMVSNIPDPTLRNLTEKKTQVNPATLHQGQKGPAFDMVSNIPDPTLRNLTEKKTQVNPATLHQGQKGPAFDMVSNIPDPTLRNLTEKKTQVNPATLHQGLKGPAFDMVSNIPDPTLRNLTEVRTHYNPVTLHEGLKERARDDAQNSLVNIAKDYATVIRDGGAPTTSNFEKIPTYEYTTTHLREPIQISRDLYADMYDQRPLQYIPSLQTRLPNVLPQNTWRFDSYVSDNLRNNPFVNNTQHKATEYIP